MATATIQKDIRQEISTIWFHLKRKLEAIGFDDKTRAKLHEQAHRAPTGLNYHDWRKQKDAKNVSSYEFLTKPNQREMVKKFLQYIEKGIDNKTMTTADQILEQFNLFEANSRLYFANAAKKSAIVSIPKTPTTFNTSPVDNNMTEKLLEAMASYEQAGFAPEVARKLHKHGISAIYAKKFIHAS